MALRYTFQILEPAVKESFSYANVLRKLGLKPTGSSYTHLKFVIQKHKLDTSHFTGQRHNKGKPSNKKKSADDFLILREPGSMRLPARKLRRSLLEIGRKYQCEAPSCKNSGLWLDKPLTLQVDHKNGNYWDNRSENLQFLCPNCHSQTKTWGSRNIKTLTPKQASMGTKKSLAKIERPKNTCIDCNKENSPYRLRCKSCAARHKAVHKIQWPPVSDLLKQLESQSYCSLAKQLGVSDNAIRKHLRNHIE